MRDYSSIGSSSVGSIAVIVLLGSGSLGLLDARPGSLRPQSPAATTGRVFQARGGDVFWSGRILISGVSFAWAVAKADRLESMSWYAKVLDLTLNTEMSRPIAVLFD